MTRITSFGRKRTYLQAGFEHIKDPKGTDVAEATSGLTVWNKKFNEGLESKILQHNKDAVTCEPPKKKRKSTSKSKRTNFKDSTTIQQGIGSIEECETEDDSEIGKALTTKSIQKTSTLVAKEKNDKGKKETSTFRISNFFMLLG